MPELPEVEITKRGIEPHIINKTISHIIIREHRLRWPIKNSLHVLENTTILHLGRRSKYILITTSKATILIHLGMSGSLRICQEKTPIEKHDHVDFVMYDGTVLRYRDPRRFGSILWTDNVEKHPLLTHLGPEPLSDAFTAEYLFQQSRHKALAIKPFLMDAKRVAGIGNIYANESLFRAGINPKIAAGSIAKACYTLLIIHIKEVLLEAIEQGGTTLKDFVREDGQTGYFQLSLSVYGRAGKQCKQCFRPIKQIKQAQRSTFYCTFCQP